MTSEGTQHPGQEPEEAGTGGPAPYASQRHGVGQATGEAGSGPESQQWTPPGGGWGTGFGDQPGRPTGYPAPAPYPAPPGAYPPPGGQSGEPAPRSPGELSWTPPPSIPPPSIPPAAPWSPQQAWRTGTDHSDLPTPQADQPAGPPAPGGGFGALPQRQPEPQPLPDPHRDADGHRPGEPPRPTEQSWPGEPQPFVPGPVQNRFESPAAPPVTAPPPTEPEPSRHGAALPFAPAGPTPLPPQEVRVPGASLAAALGGGTPTPLSPAAPPPAPPAPAPAAAPAAQPASHVPQQRGPFDEPSADADRPAFGGPSAAAAGAGGTAGRAVSASASVPAASRVSPPADQSAIVANRPPAQPRVYGRPASPEPEPSPADRPAPEHPGAPRPLPPRPAGQVAPPFGARPGSAAVAPGAGNGQDAADLALPHLSAGAHIQPASPAAADGGRGFRPSGAEPYGDLVDRPGDGAGPQSPPHFGAGPQGQAHLNAGPQSPSAFGTRPQSPPTFGGTPQGQPAFGGTPQGQPAFGAQQSAPDGYPPASGPTPAGNQWNAPDPEQNRFDAFRPEPTAPAEQEATPEPAPQVRNGRVLLAVLVAAVLLVAIPMSLVWLITRPGDQAFDPAVGACVKQSGNTAAPADCAEPNAFEVVAKVDRVDQCADPNAPHIQVAGDSGREQVLCLQPAAAGDDPDAGTAPDPSSAPDASSAPDN
ncbi:hypothetical protein O7623_20815 [Solwaraspora sp. WMMD791]|uniref:LppU/SCO3897 family protein n=1 Tax=Solwaraspora sp. WMMD791 TaxID=3016086 RepID=UPI00249A42FC|nr:hypothetical protein [Solwaraspora sp. WMMD791]WFE25796.1 hypothetical protein O7623_20815 [Solwaraspora sp. WMMD791]